MVLAKLVRAAGTESVGPGADSGQSCDHAPRCRGRCQYTIGEDVIGTENREAAWSRGKIPTA
jgi:hypothetical protein